MINKIKKLFAKIKAKFRGWRSTGQRMKKMDEDIATIKELLICNEVTIRESIRSEQAMVYQEIEKLRKEIIEMERLLAKQGDQT